MSDKSERHQRILDELNRRVVDWEANVEECSCAYNEAGETCWFHLSVEHQRRARLEMLAEFVDDLIEDELFAVQQREQTPPESSSGYDTRAFAKATGRIPQRRGEQQ